MKSPLRRRNRSSANATSPHVEGPSVRFCIMSCKDGGDTGGGKFFSTLVSRNDSVSNDNDRLIWASPQKPLDNGTVLLPSSILLKQQRSSDSLSSATLTTVSTFAPAPDDIDVSSYSSNSSAGSTYVHTADEGDPYADVREILELKASAHRQPSVRGLGPNTSNHSKPVIPSFIAYTCYLAYAILILIGHLRDTFAWLFTRGRYIRKESKFTSDNASTYAPLLQSWEHFYTRRLYHRIQDCFNRPIASNPGASIRVLERVSTNGQKSMKILGPLKNVTNVRDNNGCQIERTYTASPYFREEIDTKYVTRECVNLGCYNYLGFGDNWQSTCASDVLSSFDRFSISTANSRIEFGTTALHRELEKIVARFLGKGDAIVCNMGFNTNAATIPALTSHGDLIISDELNHTSIVNGARASGAAIRVFRHNDIVHLEEIVREAIIRGRPRTRRPWGKIMVIVEGIYSMEGEYCDLASIVTVCKKYGVHVYLDEAHSIGCMGATGRGISEYCGVNTADIDIMMGTFTKSFGGMGGYIAADASIIAYLRQRCAASSFHNALSPVVCQQIITSFKVCEPSPMIIADNHNSLTSFHSYGTLCR
jgi:serine palmitoyltransferase